MAGERGLRVGSRGSFITNIIGSGGVVFTKTGAILEDFEDQDWTDNFSVVQGDWSITSSPVFEGSYAATGQENANTSAPVLISDEKVETYGLKFRYRVYIHNTASDSEDGDFQLGWQDQSNYYQVSLKPVNTDNPELALRLSGGSSTYILGPVSPDFSRNEWLVVRGEIQSDGDVAIEVDHSGGTQRISGTISDTTRFEEGKVGPRGFVKATYDLIEINTAKSGSLPDVV